MHKDLSVCRDDFPMLNTTMHGKPLIYLDSGATSHKPQSVIDLMSSFYSKRYATVNRSVYELAFCSTEGFNKARKKVQRFINAAHSHEIIFTRGTTSSINTVAYSFGKAFIKEGDEVLISAMEHHSNIVPWQIMCEDRGAHLKVIPHNDKGELLLDELKTLLSDRTRLVAVTHISNLLGTINPIRQIADMAHDAGAVLLVDGAQAAPHLPIDVQQLDADFYAFSGHKMYGPTGIGVLYGKEEILAQMPPYQGGGDMIDEVTFEKTTYNSLPHKFEAGTPMICEVFGLKAAIEYIETVGKENIAKWEHALLEKATKRLNQIEGLRILGSAKEKAGLVTFVVDGVHSLDIGTMLDLKGIAIRTGHHCAQPILRYYDVPSTARVSFGLYNTPEEVDLFVDALKEVISVLKK